jgi:hypothetical protein
LGEDGFLVVLGQSAKDDSEAEVQRSVRGDLGGPVVLDEAYEPQDLHLSETPQTHCCRSWLEMTEVVQVQLGMGMGMGIAIAIAIKIKIKIKIKIGFRIEG